MVEENGVRKVIVMPHSTEFHPSMHPPPPHVPHYMHPHPALLPHPPHPVYPAVPGTGEMPPQFVHQHPPPPSPHVYQEQGKVLIPYFELIEGSPILKLNLDLFLMHTHIHTKILGKVWGETGIEVFLIQYIGFLLKAARVLPASVCTPLM